MLRINIIINFYHKRIFGKIITVVVTCVQKSRTLINTIQHTPQSIYRSKKELGKRVQKVGLELSFIILTAEQRN